MSRMYSNPKTKSVPFYDGETDDDPPKWPEWTTENSTLAAIADEVYGSSSDSWAPPRDLARLVAQYLWWPRTTLAGTSSVTTTIRTDGGSRMVVRERMSCLLNVPVRDIPGHGVSLDIPQDTDGVSFSLVSSRVNITKACRRCIYAVTPFVSRLEERVSIYVKPDKKEYIIMTKTRDARGKEAPFTHLRYAVDDDDDFEQWYFLMDVDDEHNPALNIEFQPLPLDVVSTLRAMCENS